MSKPRDYEAEYKRRIARAEAKGLSKKEARGHGSKKKQKKKAKKRDYQEEYRKRIAAVKVEGITRTVARGHPKKGEIHKTHHQRALQVLRVFKTQSTPEVLDAKKAAIQLIQSKDVAIKNFIHLAIEAGYTRHEAYTLWFSP